MIVQRINLSIAAFNNTIAVSDPIDMTSMMGAALAVTVTGAGGAGSMKLQASCNPADANSWVDLPTSTTAPTTQTIAISATVPHYFNTGYLAFYTAIRLHVTSSNTNNITTVIKGTAKGG